MSKDFIQSEIERILKEAKREGLDLHDAEIQKISKLISAVVKTKLSTRLLFYDAVKEVSEIINRRLAQQAQEVFNNLLGNPSKKEIWH